MNWKEDDLNRRITSLDVNKEDLQNFEVAMVVVGNDAISLYPNLKVDRVVEEVRKAVLMSEMKWREIDYL